MLFCVMYAVFAKFLRMSDGTPTYPVVLLMGISAWQFVQESTSVGLRAIVDRGDLLRKIHFPNYIVVVSSTIGALISFAINFVVVLLFALFTHVHFTWRVLLLPLNFIQLYIIALGLALLLSTMYRSMLVSTGISSALPSYCSRYYSTRCRLFTHCRW